MNTKFFLLLLALLVSQVSIASPQIQHWTTEKGARVYYVHAPELPMVDISVVFDAGAARDQLLSGTAVLTNAMLDEGAVDLNTDQIAAAFADVGARFSSSAERDMASVGLRSLTEESALQAALALYTKVLTQPSFPESSFKRIQKQILLGFQAEKQSPSALASRAFYKGLYGNHAYATMPAGTEQAVSKLTITDVKQFYQQYYVARNAVVVLVGDLNKSQAQDVAEKVTSGLAAGEAAAKIKPVVDLTQAQTIQIDHPSSQTHILMGQPGMSRSDADYFALYVGNHILGGSGLVSKLSNEIREKRGLSYSTYSYFRPMRDLGPYQFGLQTRNEQADEALKVMQDTLVDFINQGPSEAELIAAKQNITGGFALRVDSNSKIVGYLAMIGFYGLPLDYLETFKVKVNAISTAQIKQAFERRVNPNNMLTVMVGGKAK
ncbi:peptidase M16 [Methylophaga sp. 41_12_T18]|nr:peptidase M16 [Methylophaga sp. 41_12_T18]